MTPDEIRAHHQAAWDAYNRDIAKREDDYEEILSTIYTDNYYGQQKVSVTLSGGQWDMAQRLIMLGWKSLQTCKT